MRFLADMDPQELRQIFATNLRVARAARRLSQEALAADAGIARRYLSQIETADTSVGLDIICRIATALDMEPCELLVPPPKRKPLAQGGS
jgi:transcriptional regulator with XRE-family HTH domain